MHCMPALVFPFYLLHSFPWSLSLPKEGASLLYSVYCWIVFLHSHAGPPDTSVPGTYGGLRKSCEYLPRGRPQGRGRKSSGSSIREAECRVEMDTPVLLICSDLLTVYFSLSSVESKVESRTRKCRLFVNARLVFLYTQKVLNSCPEMHEVYKD